MKWHKFIKFFGLLILIVFIDGCFIVPSVTHCKGTLSIQIRQDEIDTSKQEIPKRFILVSLWEYPEVNDSSGKIVINEVILTEDSEIRVNFPFTGYWIGWTPVFGTQHLAPEPVIMAFHDNYPLRWIYGSSGREYYEICYCCAKPETKLHFSLELSNPEEILSPDLKKDFGKKLFFEKFLAEKKTLIKKMERCKGITADDKRIILEKIKQTKTELGI